MDDVAAIYCIEAGFPALSRIVGIQPGHTGDSIRFSASQTYLINGVEEQILIDRLFILNQGGKQVSHDWFEIPASLQGKGITKKVMLDSMALYERIGVKRISIHAGLSQGGYVWAKYGFVPSESAWNRISFELSERANSLYGDNVPEGLKASLARSDPKSLWDVADHPEGKKLLQGTGWMGTLSLDDIEAMSRYKHYGRR